MKTYVSTYAKYNNGSLVGQWVDLTDFTDYEAFIEYCLELHSDEPDPELMFQDFEGPKGLYSECDLSEVYEYLRELDSSGMDAEAFEAGYELDIPLESIADAYYGQYRNDEDFAYEYAEQAGFIPENQWPLNCIDWHQAARELMYDFMEENGHYFYSHY
jgi:antirestriction protein